jgi:hypothetical protein
MGPGSGESLARPQGIPSGPARARRNRGRKVAKNEAPEFTPVRRAPQNRHAMTLLTIALTI